MTTQTMFFWVIIDPLTFILGSLGGFILFHEIVDIDHLPTFKEIFQIVKRRLLACTALSISVIYFFYRMVTLIHNNL